MENITSLELFQIENGLKLNLIDTTKCNSKFLFLRSHEEELIIKKEVSLFKEKIMDTKANVTEKNTFVFEVLSKCKKRCFQVDASQPQKINKHLQATSILK